MDNIEKEVYRIIQAHQNIVCWNAFAEEFVEDFKEAKKVSESEAKRVKELCEKYFNRITEGYNESNIEREDELKAYLRLKEVVDNIKQETL